MSAHSESLEVPDRAEIDWDQQAGSGATSPSLLDRLDKQKPRSSSVRCKHRMMKFLDKTIHGSWAKKSTCASARGESHSQM